jgi:hypothetical protein
VPLQKAHAGILIQKTYGFPNLSLRKPTREPNVPSIASRKLFSEPFPQARLQMPLFTSCWVKNSFLNSKSERNSRK